MTVLITGDGQAAGLLVEPFEATDSYEDAERRYGPDRDLRGVSGPGLTVRQLRDIPVGEIQRLATSRAREMIQSVSRDYVLEDAQRWAAEFIDVLRPGRRGRGDESYAALAAIYVDCLGSRSPIQEVARFTHLSPKTVSNGLSTARSRNLLTEARKGRAGGELTDYCRDILAGMSAPPSTNPKST